jgi:mannose-6-phosphate isomerase
MDSERTTVFNKIEKEVEALGFRIDKQDRNRPWGGFFVIDESQAPQFIATYFPHLSLADFAGFEKLSPKILLVSPNKRLSWQYHFRRSEIWKVVGGTAGVVISDTDEQTDVRKLALGDIIELRQGERHRLVGLDEWGIIAEIWQHTDSEKPSDEDDIVRVQDDFGR